MDQRSAGVVLSVGDRVEMLEEGTAVPVGSLGVVVAREGTEGYGVRWDVSPVLFYLQEDLRRVDGPLVTLAKSCAMTGGGPTNGEG